MIPIEWISADVSYLAGGPDLGPLIIRSMPFKTYQREAAYLYIKRMRERYHVLSASLSINRLTIYDSGRPPVLRVFEVFPIYEYEVAT